MNADPQLQPGRESLDATPSSVQIKVSRGARSFGYLVAAAINAALIFVVNNLLEWDVLPWLTADFERVVGILSLSLGASVVANLAFAAYDAPWFKSVGQIAMAGFGFAATVRLFQVFPFDFSAYDFNWGLVARVLLIAAMVGIGISVLVELGKLVRNRG